MTFFSPFAFLFLITIPAIILLYILKQRNQDYTVSSLFLWEEVLKDLEANAPWQKLRRNLLMILQVIAMLFLIFALARPFLNTEGSKAGSAIIIIDNSFSMQASDVKPNRFEAAKKEAAAYVSSLKPGTLITLISAGERAIIEENLRSDKEGIINKINSLKVSNYASNFEDTASTILSVASQQSGAEVVLFGDNEIKIPGVDMKFSKISQTGSNYALTLFTHTRTKNGITALSRAANFSSAAVDLPISLYADSKVFDAKKITVSAGETVNVYWSEIPSDTQLLECRIDLPDCLQADNKALSPVNPDMTAKALLVTQKNIFLEKVLSLKNNIELVKTTPQEVTESGGEKLLKGYSLYIFDGVMPDKLPTDGNILIFSPVPNRYFSLGEEIEHPELFKTKHQLFKYVDDYGFTIGKAKKLSIPKWAEPVLDSSLGTLIFTGTLENRKITVFGFDLHSTDLPLRPAYPILMTNVIEHLVPESLKNIEAVYPGQEIDFNLNPKSEQARVITPSGRIVPIAPPFPAQIFDETEEIGHFVLEQAFGGEKSYHSFTVNPPAEKESNLLAGEKPNPIDGKAPANAAKKPVSGMNLQWLMLCIAIIILLIEWWVYSNGV